MRIIDKMHDYYDYLQDSTDNLVFDLQVHIPFN